MSPNEPKGFFDKNTLLAIVLSFGVFFIWQTYVNKKYPKAQQNIAVSENKPSNSEKPKTGEPSETSSTSENETVDSLPKNKMSQVTETKLKSYEIDLSSSQLAMTNLGMGFSDITLKSYKDRSGSNYKHLAKNPESPLFATTLNGQNLLFAVERVSENEFIGTYNGDGFSVVKKVKLSREKYLIDSVTKVTSQSPQILLLSHSMSASVKSTESSFFLPSYENQEVFVLNNDGSEREIITTKDPLNGLLKQVKISALSSQYFSLAIWNKSSLLPITKYMTNNQEAQVIVSYQSPEPKGEMSVETSFYYGPKDMAVLSTLSEDMTEMIDYGFFGFIGKPLLSLLKLLFSVLQNWGLAIIALTILLRTALLPINVYSMKSMKKMQKIQPKLKAIKEKYKSDPQRVNQETMMLMKSEKANPLSGCLPMLLQIPIFFAFFQVLGKSIELYQAPFVFWLQDLSIKDPYYIMPVLVGGLFFLQQKVTPTAANMDPAQQKMMQFLPLIFCVFMVSMPSGLTLYMVVNSLFAIVQQYVFMSEKKTA